MRALCIIPARAGSKRIPNKHIRPFNGKPIIDYSLEAAFRSSVFDDVIVFTNDVLLADHVRKAHPKTTIMTRKDDNADADAILYRAVVECLATVKADRACVLYPCAPFVQPFHLYEGYLLLSTFDVVFPVIQNDFHIEQTLCRLETGQTTMMFPENNNINTPDGWTPTFRHASQWFWCDVEKLFVNQTLIPENSGSIVLPWYMGQDIDTEHDWVIAEMKHRHFVGHVNELTWPFH